MRCTGPELKVCEYTNLYRLQHLQLMFPHESVATLNLCRCCSCMLRNNDQVTCTLRHMCSVFRKVHICPVLLILSVPVPFNTSVPVFFILPFPFL